MEMINFFMIFSIFYTTLEISLSKNQDPVRIILVKGENQENLLRWFEGSLKTYENELKVNLDVIELNDEEEDTNKLCSSLSKGVTLLIDISLSGNDRAVEISKEMAVPYIQIDLSISPWLTLLDKFLAFRNSTDVVLIFDNQKNVDEALYFWIDTTILRMVMCENLDETSAERLRAMRPIPNNLAIIATTANINIIFKKALEEQLVTLPDRWNLIFLDFQYKQFEKPLIRNKPINLLHLNEDLCCRFLNKEQSCSCPDDFVLPKYFLTSTLDTLFHVVLNMRDEGLNITSNLSCNDTKYDYKIKKQFEELLDKEILKQDFIYKENNVLRVKIDGTIEIGVNDTTENIATFNYDQGIVVVEGRAIQPIKSFYRIGITESIPWSYKAVDLNGKEYWTGYCADFARKLAEFMKFDFEFVEPINGTFGDKKNGVWDGVIGDLATGNTDIAVTSLIMTADREEVVDFIAPYFEQSGLTIVMRKPERKTSLFKFMTVLKLEVWLSIVGALIVTGFMVWFLDKYSPYSARNSKNTYAHPCREFTLKESFWFALTSFTPQGGGEAPKALSGRTLVAAYWLFVVLMLATFTANLAAFLTVERMQTPVQSLEQLARQSRINYTVVKDSDAHMYFINMKNAEDTLYRMWKELTLNASTDETQYRVWDYPIREQYGHILMSINDSNPVTNASEGFRIVNERIDADFAFIHDSAQIKYEITRNCNLTEVGEVFAERPFAVAVQQGSHLQDEISRAILTLQGDRFFEQLEAKYWNNSAKGNCPSTDEDEGITLQSLGGVFIATLFGLALAMLTLVGEVFYYRGKRKGKITIQRKNKMPGDPSKIMQDEMVKSKQPITIGETFKPVNYNNKDVANLSHITLYPRSRNPLTRIN